MDSSCSESHRRIGFITELPFKEASDVSQTGLEGAKCLLQEVVPAVEAGRGRLLVGAGRVREGGARQFMDELATSLLKSCEATVSDPAEEELVFVLGVAQRKQE